MHFINRIIHLKRMTTWIIIISIIHLIATGCATVQYRNKEFVRNEKIPNSKKIAKVRYELIVLNRITKGSPELDIQINIKRDYDEKYSPVFKKEKWGQKNIVGTVVARTLAGVGAAAFVGGFFGFLYTFDDEGLDKSDRGSTILVTLGGLGLVGIFKSATEENIVRKGTVIKKGQEFTKSSTTIHKLNDFDLNVSSGSVKTKNFVSNSDGEITINLVKDFNLRQFQNPQPIKFKLFSKKLNLQKIITLNPKDWTRQYVQINKSEVPFKSDPNRSSQTFNLLDGGTEYEVVNELDNYYSIEDKGVRGYIAKTNANSFWSIPERLDPKNPPKLIVKHVEFSDPSGDQFLDAEETGTIKVYMKNTGRGNAYRVGLKVNADKSGTSSLSFPEFVSAGTLKPGESKTVKLNVRASSTVKDGNIKFKLSAIEANGFDAQPVNLTLQKRAFRPPLLEIADYGIDDANKNGRIELGEAVDVTVRIRNSGTGPAKNVVAQVNLDKSAQNIYYDGYTNTFELNELKPGEFKDVKFSVLTNNRYKMNYIPITITINESKGKYGSSIPLNLPLDKSIKGSKDFVVEGVADNTPVRQVNALTPDVDVNIPVTGNKNPNAVAVIIGLSKYQNKDIPTVDYAKRDADIIKEYLLKSFGYDKKKIIELYDYNATLASFRTVFEEQLPNLTQGNDVFIYYSGHGVPDLKTEEAYFAPYDFNPSYTKSTGYKLNDFYKSLRSLNARSITVVIDACFSGTSYGGQIYEGISSINIRVKNPQMLLNNGLVLTSSKSNQVSTWYREKKHGLFTYYFLKGLQGAADQNRDNKLTVSEIKTYLQKNVSETANFQNRKQTPQVFGDPKRVLLKY